MIHYYTYSNRWRLFYMVVLLSIGSVSLLVHQHRIVVTPKTTVQELEFSYSDMSLSDTVRVSDQVRSIRYTLVDGLPLVEGDIILKLADEGINTAGTGVPFADRHWNDGLVPYAIDPTLPDRFRVHDAIAHWEDVTDIRFVLRDEMNEHLYPDYVYFRPSNGCSSYVGRVGGMQPINLAKGCTTGSTIHEIGHAVGLWHEQSRIDRDQYVTIHYENIIPETIFNFNQHITDGEDIGEYDYQSIMHYPRWAFTKNGEDTIVPKQDVEIGQRDVLSQGDIDAIGYLYESILQPAQEDVD